MSLECAELVLLLLAVVLLPPAIKLPIVVPFMALVLFSFGQTVIIQSTCVINC